LYAILGSTTSTPLKWSVSSGQLPPGMTLDQDRGVVRGTPFSSAAGSTYRFRVNITSLNPSPNGPASAICAAGGCPEYSISVR
ncbi:MAG TPA: putative Ig domain-containing protein, partial [Terriglobales bacterium]|nr:putative Ig domain-containing protein [Terriglobales bacterium]